MHCNLILNFPNTYSLEDWLIEPWIGCRTNTPIGWLMWYLIGSWIDWLFDVLVSLLVDWLEWTDVKFYDCFFLELWNFFTFFMFESMIYFEITLQPGWKVCCFARKATYLQWWDYFGSGDYFDQLNDCLLDCLFICWVDWLFDYLIVRLLVWLHCLADTLVDWLISFI